MPRRIEPERTARELQVVLQSSRSCALGFYVENTVYSCIENLLFSCCYMHESEELTCSDRFY